MASSRTEFHVVPAHGRWQIKRDGRPGTVFEHRQDAVDRAVKDANAAQPSQLIIHTADGRIDDEQTYQDDAFPPRDESA